MLKLTLKPGEFIDIGEEIRVVFSGGSSNNIHLLVEAPRSYNIARSGALRKRGICVDEAHMPHYRAERELSPEAKKKIYAIIAQERRKNRRGEEEG